MRERTLCERLMDAGEARAAPSGKLDRSALSASILSNLQEILNSRAGCCETRRDFGMPDFNDLSSQFPDAIPVISRAIKTQIENFEPRLSSITVRHMPDPRNALGLTFMIAVTLTIDDETERLSFQTDLAEDGKLRVHS